MKYFDFDKTYIVSILKMHDISDLKLGMKDEWKIESVAGIVGSAPEWSRDL